MMKALALDFSCEQFSPEQKVMHFRFRDRVCFFWNKEKKSDFQHLSLSLYTLLTPDSLILFWQSSDFSTLEALGCCQKDIRSVYNFTGCQNFVGAMGSDMKTIVVMNTICGWFAVANIFLFCNAATFNSVGLCFRLDIAFAISTCWLDKVISV